MITDDDCYIHEIHEIRVASNLQTLLIAMYLISSDSSLEVSH